jgi:hypothetical protein
MDRMCALPTKPLMPTAHRSETLEALIRRWPSGDLLAAALLAVAPAALWGITLWGRTTVQGMSARWAATFALAWAATWLWTIVPHATEPDATRSDTGVSPLPRGTIPLSLLPVWAIAAALVTAIYLSEDVHHAFVYQPLLKGIFLPVVFLLTLSVPVWSRAIAVALTPDATDRLTAALRAARVVVLHYQRAIVVVVLAAAGLLHALSFNGVATDDLIRYWAIADGILSGTGYPVTTGEAGGSGFYLVELPVYPLLATGSFLVAGHRFSALTLPLIAANVVLPFAFYALARSTGAGRLAAFWLALAVLSFPHYQIYTLGAPEPESLLAVWVSLALWLAIRRLSGTAAFTSGSVATAVEWLGIGAFSALAVLSRPEGVLYVGPLYLGIGWQFLRRTLQDRRLSRQHLQGPVLAAVVCALPVGAFVAFLYRQFGILWPAGWTNVAGAHYVLPNVRLVLKQNLPHYALVSGLPDPSTAGLLIASVLGLAILAGLVRLLFSHPYLWFVPLALGLNTAVIFASPTYLTLDLFSPPTFFRHISVLFPWCIPALAMVSGQWAVVSNQSPYRPWGQHAAPRRWLRSSVVALALAALLLAQLAVLGASTARDQAQVPTILTQDPYVLVTDLWQAQDELPFLPFTTSGPRNIAAIDPSFDYMGFRSGLFDAVRPYDLHFNDAGRAYVLAIGVFALWGLGVLAAIRVWGTAAQRGALSQTSTAATSIR